MPPADPALDASDPTASARLRIERQLAALDRLTELGMEIAEAVARTAKAAAAPEEDGRPDHPLLFARVSRAVRMTIALQSRLMKDLAALDRAEEMAERARATKRRIRLGRLVEDAVADSITAQRAAGRRFSDEDAVEDEIERLAEEACERLADAEEDLDGLAFDDAVAAICADLGLSPDWTARLMAATGGGDGGATPLPPSPTGGEGWLGLPPCGGGGDPRVAWGGEGSRRPARSEHDPGPPRAPP